MELLIYFMERKNVDTAAIAACFRALEVQHRPRGNTGRKNKYRYLDCLASFDIETTSDSSTQQAWMYVWQFALKNGNSEICEFIAFQHDGPLPRHRLIVTAGHSLTAKKRCYSGHVFLVGPEVGVVSGWAGP